jgi:transposase
MQHTRAKVSGDVSVEHIIACSSHLFPLTPADPPLRILEVGGGRASRLSRFLHGLGHRCVVVDPELAELTEEAKRQKKKRAVVAAGHTPGSLYDQKHATNQQLQKAEEDGT